ncbi:alpha/beta hydrolase [Synechococcus sp. CCY 0621]|uniref:alpha/beta hydrolase n=1 Tax=Synechococcus sp. CCY 0621 TaxID=2815603 RepID=UPI001C239E2F|nr:alpha/beta hydrolase [Synechococcus sp. CCY 0621]
MAPPMLRRQRQPHRLVGWKIGIDPVLKRSFAGVIAALSAGLAGALMAAAPVQAGETLSFSYGPLIRSLKISSLKTFADSGKVPEDLAYFLQFSSPKQQVEFRKALVQKTTMDPLLVSRFFNSAMGESLLERLGRAITITRAGNGKYAIRSALVAAAFSKDGLSLLSVLEQLPTNVQIHGEAVLGAAKAGERVIKATETLTTTLRNLTAQEAATQTPVDYAALPDPRKPGPFVVKKDVWNLVDQGRQRKFYVDVYRPEGKEQKATSIIVFSHGLASRPEDFEEALKHLATHGFLVAAPQHPGSDAIWLKEMLNGLHKDIFDGQEFVNRPKDISYVIDELGRRNQKQFGGKLDLERVGVAGHSFGGYTVLAIAGASIDFDHLKQECDREFGGLNASLLLQCRALELPRQTYQLQDPRAAAVFAGNPVNRAIFGPKGLSNITIPILIGSGSYDPAAPAAMEQAASFTWLTVPQRYWMMAEGQAHVNFSKIDPGIEDAIKSATNLTLPSQGLISGYVNAIIVPFFATHIQNSDSFRPFLRPAYAQYLSKNQTFKLDFISGASTPGLVNAIETFKKNNR